MRNASTPFATDIVIRIYHEYPNEIGNAQLKELFGVSSGNAISKIKTGIRKKMIENGNVVWNPMNVSTKATFEFAGINIDDYKRRYREKKRLGLEETCDG